MSFFKKFLENAIHNRDPEDDTVRVSIGSPRNNKSCGEYTCCRLIAVLFNICLKFANLNPNFHELNELLDILLRCLNVSIWISFECYCLTVKWLTSAVCSSVNPGGSACCHLIVLSSIFPVTLPCDGSGIYQKSSSKRKTICSLEFLVVCKTSVFLAVVPGEG